jgi:hypothetical protein
MHNPIINKQILLSSFDPEYGGDIFFQRVLTLNWLHGDISHRIALSLTTVVKTSKPAIYVSIYNLETWSGEPTRFKSQHSLSRHSTECILYRKWIFQSVGMLCREYYILRCDDMESTWNTISFLRKQCLLCERCRRRLIFVVIIVGSSQVSVWVYFPTSYFYPQHSNMKKRET